MGANKEVMTDVELIRIWGMSREKGAAPPDGAGKAGEITESAVI